MERKPTMHDVARAAGVGTMTVSRVLNASQHVSKATAERVMRAVQQLDYRPNEMARSLRSARSRTIGLIVPGLNDSFYATCADSVNRVAQEHGYTVLLTTSNDDVAREYSEARLMLQRHVEGLVVVPADPRDCPFVLPEFRSTPIVALDRPIGTPDAGHCLDTVVVQNHEGARQAVHHLIEHHDHQEILFLGYGAGLYTVRSRFEGYKEAMDQAGLETQESFDCSSSEAAVELLRHAIEKKRVSAVFSGNNLVTRRVLYALLQLGVRIPEDIALIGFDDFELADLLHPALTVIRQPVAELGETAARLLFQKLRTEGAARPAKQLVLPVEFVQRHSCGCVYERTLNPVEKQPSAHPIRIAGSGLAAAPASTPRPAQPAAAQ